MKLKSMTPKATDDAVNLAGAGDDGIFMAGLFLGIFEAFGIGFSIDKF